KDLAVWPEYAFQFYFQQASTSRIEVLSLSREISLTIVAGGPRFSLGVNRPREYNSAFVIDDGRVVDLYDKVRLVPFAERSVFPWWQRPRTTTYTPGSELRPVATRFGKIGALICFEGMYPDSTRNLSIRGAKILANLVNDGWFGSSSAARMHLEMASLR